MKMAGFKVFLFLLFICFLNLTGGASAATLVTCSGSTACTISVWGSADPTQYATHTIELVVPKDSSGNPIPIPDDNVVAFKYDGTSYSITCDGTVQNLGSSSYPELQNKISCTVTESRTGVSINLTLFDQSTYSNTYSECPGYTVDATLKDTNESSPYCVSDSTIAQISACKWEKQNLNDSLLNTRGVPLNYWVVYGETTVAGLELGYQLPPPPPPGVSETDYVCAQDLNGNGLIDEGEIDKCLQVGSDYFCPIGAVQCSENQNCPLGDYPCNNGTCTKTGVCSSTQVPYTDYLCPVTGQIYQDQITCNNNCIQVGSCSASTSQQPATVTSNNWGTIVYYGEMFGTLPYVVGSGSFLYFYRYGSLVATVYVDGASFSGKLSFKQARYTGFYHYYSNRICNDLGDCLYISGVNFSADLGVLVWAHPVYIKKVTEGEICFDAWNDGCDGYIRFNKSVTSYVCSLNNQTYSDLTTCQNNCRQRVTCVTHTDYTTKWVCSLNNQQYDTQSQCTSSCYQTASCSTSYTCPLGNYPCLNVNGIMECSPNECVQYGSGTVNDDSPEGVNDKQDDGQVDPNTGECLGTIYIFNGYDRRCRPPGAQTGWSNCCANKDRWLGLVECSESEQQLSEMKSKGLCHYVGEYCASKFLGICLQKKKTYCCFNSKLARIIAEQGRPQLKSFGSDGGWGDPKHPNCRGFTPEEFQMLDFSKIDLSEWYGDIQTKAQTEIQNNMKNNLQNFYNQTVGN